MNILMINPPSENILLEYPNEKGEGFIETEDFGSFPPLGALYVLSYLEKKLPDHNLFFMDCVAEKITHTNIKSLIENIKPDIVGITSFTLSLIDVIQVAQTIRQSFPHSHICLGGHHPTSFPFEAAELKEFDSIIVGEGEISFTELVQAISNNHDFTHIQGVFTKQSIQKWKSENFSDHRFLNNVCVPPAYVEDIDQLPIPNRNFIKHINYQSIVGVSKKLATIISSRGCPYKCTFCDVPFKKYRQRNISHVVDEIELCLSLGYEEIHFYDDLFNITPNKVIEFCEEIQSRNIRFHWDFRGRINTVTYESLQMAKRSGCRMISFGIETGTDEGLKTLKKGVTTEKIKDVFKWCKQLKIKTIADFMIGLPSEKNKQDVLNNIDFLIQLNPTYAQISILSLYPHTQIYDQAVGKRLIKEGRWKDFALNPSKDFLIDHWEEFISIKELVRLQKQSYKKFYYRPSYILKSIFSTTSFFEFVLKIKGALKLFK